MFQVVSVLLAGVLAVGIVQPRRRVSAATRRYWHAVFMSASLMMIVATGIAQVFDRLSLASDHANAIVFLQVPVIVGFVVLLRSARRQLTVVR